MAYENKIQWPCIDFSDLDPKQPRSERWEKVRTALMAALEEHTGFQAIYRKIGKELNEALFTQAVKELYSVPTETRATKNKSEKTYRGHLGGLPGLSYESCAIENAQLQQNVEHFANLLWPCGNPGFCHTVRLFAEHLVNLHQIIMRMILESLGIEKHLDFYMESSACAFRMNEYIPKFRGTTVGLPGHLDQNLTTIICDNQVPGLQVQNKDGEWNHLKAEPDSYTFIVGEALQAWSNGRLRPTHHRVIISGDRIRHSTLFVSFPKDGYLIKAPPELIDQEHPLLFTPYDFNEYVRFSASTEAFQINPNYRLQAFCGAVEEK